MPIHPLLRATPNEVAQACTQNGMLVFLDEELTPINVATIAANAITKLNQEAINLHMFFATSLTYDDSYESIRYEVEDFNPSMSVVAVRRIITYRSFGNVTQPPKIDRGPLVPRTNAEAFVESLNNCFGQHR